jgi:hypothetical protein
MITRKICRPERACIGGSSAPRLDDKQMRLRRQQMLLRRQVNIARGAADPPVEFGGAFGKAFGPFVDQMFQAMIISAGKGAAL